MDENYPKWRYEPMYGRLHYNKATQNFEILKDYAFCERDRETGETFIEDWETEVHTTLHRGDELEVCASGTWTQTRLERCRGGWCLVGTPYRGRLDNIPVRWYERVIVSDREY